MCSYVCIMRTNFIIIGIIYAIILITATQSCMHESIPGGLITDPNDTIVVDTIPIDTEPNDTIQLGPSCNPDSVYFANDVLPILLGSCAIIGCHDVQSHEEGVILVDYAKVISTGKVRPFKLSNSDLYEVIVSSNAKKVMPPTGKMPQSQIDIIAKWINQGALNLSCNNTSNCDTINTVSFSAFVGPLMIRSCNGCHSKSIANGGVVLDSYAAVKKEVGKGRLYGSMAGLSGYISMPQGQAKINNCSISKIKKWIDEGAQNN